MAFASSFLLGKPVQPARFKTENTKAIICSMGGPHVSRRCVLVGLASFAASMGLTSAATAIESLPQTKIFVVDQHHEQGDGGEKTYKTISLALEHAKQGDIILVRPGAYYESLVINIPNIKIVGDGNRDLIVIQSPNDKPTVHAQANNVHLQNLKLLHGNANSRGLMNACVIQDANAQGLNMNKCQISSFSGMGLVSVASTETSSKPKLTMNQCMVRDCNHHGLFIQDGSTIQDCLIADCGMDGIAVHNMTHPTRIQITNNTFSSNRGYHTSIIHSTSNLVLKDNQFRSAWNQGNGDVFVFAHPAEAKPLLHGVELANQTDRDHWMNVQATCA
eukprot:CAMPEP_0184707982 /NCGR_PEP_ID=MMETSP0313-20130426/37541_1 /TAXON_ID=2792 /ORGANISM="Porphyridium aerugineum, Strain SAG 1380-2" /LENGTH=332 /DNA_ID=CAMNT_0027169563 /DNA_START=1173 /DNA_END=2171 /DNA_ORIENTATION=+